MNADETIERDGGGGGRNRSVFAAINRGNHRRTKI